MNTDNPELHSSHTEDEELPHFSDEMTFPNGNRLILEHVNFNEIEKILLHTATGRIIDLKIELPLPDDIKMGIGADFGFINDRRREGKKIEMPDIRSFKKFSDAEKTNNEYLLLIFHEYMHAVSTKQEELSEKLQRFWESLPNKLNLTPSEARTMHKIEWEAELNAWEEALTFITALENKYLCKILPPIEELENELVSILETYQKKWNIHEKLSVVVSDLVRRVITERNRE